MKKNYLILSFIAVLFTMSCKKWDSHIAVTTPDLNETLMAQIKSRSELSLFESYIVKAKLDTLLNSSKDFTVFAPDNDALGSLPSSISSDPAQLRAFVLNLISGKSYFTRDQADTLRIAMLNGKRISFDNNHFDDATIKQGDIFASNGVLHIIDKAIVPLPNIWEYINLNKDNFEQNNYIASLNYAAQDPNTAVVDSLDLLTGEPIYDPNTGIVQINTYRKEVYDIANEDSLYTYILLTNTAFEQQQTMMQPYFNATSQDTSLMNADWSVVRDLTIKGKVDPDQLSQVLLSKFNVHLAIDPNHVVSSQKMSNGIVYVVNSIAPSLSEKIPIVYVQGENPVSFSSTDANKLADIFYRQRYNPIAKDTFTDIYMNLGSSGANFFANYTTNDLFTTTYKVYWVALNDHVISGQGDGDYGTDSTLDQRVQISSNEPPYALIFDTTGTVEPNTYTETYVGEFTNDSYNWLLSYPKIMPDGKSYLINPATKNIRLQAPAAAVGRPYNLTLDYFKFVPVFH
ncbi:fasciclin domain-containing protein [Arachidicoccus sp.]|uniref:fasciclin domain-containing protein n=1 Tax=Arachidicoccus sp. TaxID=1872624 RepID=UPI003D22D8EC